MKLADFDFDLPDTLIATRPAVPRTAARMLVAQGAKITDSTVADLGQWLRAGDRLVLNNTRVIPARLSGTRARHSAQGLTEARLQVTLLEPRADGTWAALIKPLKKLKPKFWLCCILPNKPSEERPLTASLRASKNTPISSRIFTI